MSAIQWTATERNSRPRRNTLAIVAVLAGVVCGAATISAAMTRPGDDRRPAAAPPGVVIAPPSPVAAPAASQAPTVPSRGAAASSDPRRRPDRGTASDPSGWVRRVARTRSRPARQLDRRVRRRAGQRQRGEHRDPAGTARRPRHPARATLEFWQAIGEVSRRTGYRRGAIITGHRIDPDGALAGGICTVSTALFNAAARAGLQITERTSHSGYLAKYPLGLDAAVAKGDGFRQSMAFRNDTTEPIVIRTVSTPGIARVDLYGRERRSVGPSRSASRRSAVVRRHMTATSGRPRYPAASTAGSRPGATG